MTRATKTKYYPQQYLDLAEKLSQFPSTYVELEFETKEEATGFRLEFYSFRHAAEEEGLTKMYPELCAITIVVDKADPRKLVIRHKDYTPNAIALQKALEKAK